MQKGEIVAKHWHFTLLLGSTSCGNRPARLLKAHIDYLMMTGLLMTFFLLFNHFQVSPPPIVVFTMSLGSFMNPVGFIALSIKPTLRQRPTSPFGAIMAGSFTSTTIGYARLHPTGFHADRATIRRDHRRER
jgi:hypothetical protein